MRRAGTTCSQSSWTDELGRGRSTTLAALVREYLANQSGCADDLAFYRKPKTWRGAVTRATTAEWLNAKGQVKRHPHQRRIPLDALERASRRLLKATLRDAKDFEDLHNRVARATQGIPKFKELTIYDTAHRIGAWMKPRLRPKHVYLHRGTRKGARELGLDHRKDKLKRSELPVELQRMHPEEVENFLCHCCGMLAPFARRPA